MRLLAFDPGAERLGWAVLQGEEGAYRYYGSGVIRTPRGDTEMYQPYRLRLIESLVGEVNALMSRWSLGGIANETVPPAGGGAFASNGIQAQLAATALATVQTLAVTNALPVTQVAAITVKKRIGGVKTATKVKVRNGVFTYFPDLKEVKWKQWVKEHDESDACAVGLVALGA